MIGAEDDATPLLTVRSPLSPSAASPSASRAEVTARHVRIWMVSPAAALRDAPASRGYSIHELRACAQPAVQPGAPAGRCAAAAEANGLHVFHFEVRSRTPHVHAACARCMCMCMCTCMCMCMCMCMHVRIHTPCMCALHVHVRIHTPCTYPVHVPRAHTLCIYPSR